MSKTLKLTIFILFLGISGWIYVKFYQPEQIKPYAATGNTVVIKMRSLENKWTFCWEKESGDECTTDPIVVKAGDRVQIKILNEDTYDHGWALETFAVNRRLFPKQETTVEFLASKPGQFRFYCSVPCGEGHYSQTGTLIVEE